MRVGQTIPRPAPRPAPASDPGICRYDRGFALRVEGLWVRLPAAAEGLRAPPSVTVGRHGVQLPVVRPNRYDDGGSGPGPGGVALLWLATSDSKGEPTAPSFTVSGSESTPTATTTPSARRRRWPSAMPCHSLHTLVQLRDLGLHHGVGRCRTAEGQHQACRSAHFRAMRFKTISCFSVENSRTVCAGPERHRTDGHMTMW